MFMLVVEDSSSIPDEIDVLASQPDHERKLGRWEDDKVIQHPPFRIRAGNTS